MSTSWFITPYDPKAWEDPDDTSEKPISDLKINPVQFGLALKTQFLGINFEPYEWVWKFPDKLNQVIISFGMRGMLHEDQQIISFDINEGVVEFILWYRQFISDKYRLYFFNSSSWERLELTQNTSAQAIIRFIAGKPN